MIRLITILIQYNPHLIAILGGGGGVQLGPLGTAASNRPIVPAPGDYGDEEIGGMMIGRGKYSREIPRQCHFVHHKPHMLCSDANPGRSSGIPASLLAGETTCPQSCSLATAVLLSPVYISATWQWVYVSQNFMRGADKSLTL
jgi:hypothetical protein